MISLFKQISGKMSDISLTQWIFIALSAGLAIGALIPALVPAAIAIAVTSVISPKFAASILRATTPRSSNVIPISAAQAPMQSTYAYDETQGVS